MAFTLEEIKIDAEAGWEEALQREVTHLLGQPMAYRLLRRSFDGRKRPAKFNCKILVEGTMPRRNLSRHRPKEVEESPYEYLPVKGDVAVVGAGPAGLFCAYALARGGARVHLFERGKPVEARVKDVEHFFETGELNTSSNVQFGEGGAGTFSDGKLTSRSKDPRGAEVLRLFASWGAPEEILYLQKPHIGTDRLRKVLLTMRQEMASSVVYHFEEEVMELGIKDGKVTGLVTEKDTYAFSTVVLALGHSARDLFATLSKSLVMEPKPFAVGFRIEHPQERINALQYKKRMELADLLGAADYRLTATDPVSGRGGYTFCMCPGGSVVAAASEEGRLVTNGMSTYPRDLQNANAALLVSVSPKDFGGGVLGGIAFQREIEERAYRLGGGGFIAPVMGAEDFLGRGGEVDLTPSYRPGVVEKDIRTILPRELTESLQRSLLLMEEKVPLFAKGALLTAVESRSSSPVRLLRQDNLEAKGVSGLYPIGEGAGYAGGIMSAAIDGLKAAESIARKGELR